MIDSVFKAIRLPFFVFGMALIFAVERYFSAEDYYIAILISGFCLILLACISPILSSISAAKKGLSGESKSWKIVFLWMSVVSSSPILYQVYKYLLGDQAIPQDLGQKFLLVSWLTTLVCGTAFGIGVEKSHRNNGIGPLSEPKRVLLSGKAWLIMGLILGSLASINYTAAKKDKSFDLTYLKSSTPGESTIKMVKLLTKPLEVAVFYPKSNEVKPYVDEYFEVIKNTNSIVEVSFYDKDYHPSKAEEFKVSSNGQIILRQGEKRERISIGTKLKNARSNLRKLDSLFQKSFLALTEEKKSLYFTIGHGEMVWGERKNQLRSLKNLQVLLRSQNYRLKKFGAKQGSLTGVPDDAAAIVIVGPSQPFLKEEVEVLKEYVVAKGGKLLVFLDIEFAGEESGNLVADGPDYLLEFLRSAGLTYHKTPLANDSKHITATRSPIDKWFIFTNVFGSHDSVTNLSKHDDKVQLFVFQSGYFTFDKKNKEGWQGVETVKTLSTTYADIDRNYAYNKDAEKKRSYVVGVALTPSAKNSKAGGKIAVYGDATAVSDPILRNPANQLIAVDSLKWLVGKSKISGAIASEEDVKIQHSKARELWIFHSSIVAVPMMVLLLGFLMTRKRRRGRMVADAA